MRGLLERDLLAKNGQAKACHRRLLRGMWTPCWALREQLGGARPFKGLVIRGMPTTRIGATLDPLHARLFEPLPPRRPRDMAARLGLHGLRSYAQRFAPGGFSGRQLEQNCSGTKCAVCDMQQNSNLEHGVGTHWAHVCFGAFAATQQSSWRGEPSQAESSCKSSRIVAMPGGCARPAMDTGMPKISWTCAKARVMALPKCTCPPAWGHFNGQLNSSRCISKP